MECRPSTTTGKAAAVWEETSTCTMRTTGVEVQASEEGFAEIASGRCCPQQGLTAARTGRSRLKKTKAVGGDGTGTWARSSEDGGVTPIEEVYNTSPPEVTPEAGEGALGTWRSGNSPGHRTRRKLNP